MISTEKAAGCAIQNGCHWFKGELDCKGRALADPSNWTTEPSKAALMREEIARLVVSRAQVPYREKLSVKKMTVITVAVAEEAE